MQLWCRKCEAAIIAENVDVERLIARCHKCHTLFSFADNLEKPLGKRAKNQLRFMPDGIDIMLIEEGVRLTVPWYHSQVLTMTYFAVGWLAFVLFSSMTSLPGVIHFFYALVSLWLLYSVLAGFLNKTLIEVNDQFLTVSHGPLPYPGRRFRQNQIRQVYCKEKIAYSKGWPTLSYDLRVILQSDKHVALVTGVEESDYVLYLEQEIERHLKIKNRPIRGQLRPD